MFITEFLYNWYRSLRTYVNVRFVAVNSDGEDDLEHGVEDMYPYTNVSEENVRNRRTKHVEVSNENSTAHATDTDTAAARSYIKKTDLSEYYV